MKTFNQASTHLDSTDWHILEELQADARLPFSELGRRVGLSAPAVTERVRRLEKAGIIKRYTVELDTEKVGLTITAFVQIDISHMHVSTKQIERIIQEQPEILMCHAVTGSDSYIMQLAVTSIAHLERVLSKLRPYGHLTTSISLFKVVEARGISTNTIENEE